MAALRLFMDHLFSAHLASIGGFLLAIILVARLLNERRAPANTMAWLLVIGLIPWLGVPLYLIFGGRKLLRLAKNKRALLPVISSAASADAPSACVPVARTVQAAGGFKPLGGNSLRLLLTGEEDFAELERRITEARHSIHITIFILGTDATGARIVELLARRASEGIKVRLLLDALGSFRSSHRFVGPIRRAGGEVARFMPVLPVTLRGSANLRNHRKMAIFDGSTAVVGGRNFAREYMGPTPFSGRWRDFGAVIEGPAVAVLEEVFIADWCFASHQQREVFRSEDRAADISPKGSCELQVIPSGPDMPGDPLYEGIVAMIQEAEKSISIVTPYFIPDEVLLRSLIVKARAGCRVTLIVPARSNHPVTDFARRDFTRELIAAGGRMLLYEGGMLHAKAIVIDNRVALFGSPNFDLRSLLVNFEIGIIVHTPADVAAIRAWVDDLAAECALPTLTQRRVLGRVAEDVCRLFAPLL